MRQFLGTTGYGAPSPRPLNKEYSIPNICVPEIKSVVCVFVMVVACCWMRIDSQNAEGARRHCSIYRVCLYISS